ncbi:MAG TPA: alpha/beta hydrolase [Planctomycetaceae bacterium]
MATRRVRNQSVDLLIYTPTERTHRGVLLWIHGGGYVIGSARGDTPFASATAAQLGIVVVSANYRLAPRHPFPAAHDDVRRAWDWIVANTPDLDVDLERAVIGGESAGAGLAAGLVQALHDGAGPQPKAQWLFAPMLDDRTAADTDLDGLHHFVWDNVSNRASWRAYLGQYSGASKLPAYAAPARREDLAGLPSAYITCGSIELFYEENVSYATRLRDAGVRVDLDVVEGAPHGFESWAGTSPQAVALLRRARQWLAEFI